MTLVAVHWNVDDREAYFDLDRAQSRAEMARSIAASSGIESLQGAFEQYLDAVAHLTGVPAIAVSQSMDGDYVTLSMHVATDVQAAISGDATAQRLLDETDWVHSALRGDIRKLHRKIATEQWYLQTEGNEDAQELHDLANELLSGSQDSLWSAPGDGSRDRASMVWLAVHSS